HRNQLFEIYGWLHRPTPPLNPGSYDTRQALAADRIFAEVRIPRSTGMQLLNDSNAAPKTLTQLRTFLHAKLLDHTATIDSEAAHSMLALLLGRREPILANVQESFADTGVAYLLAISGLHLVFFTAMIWSILRFIPMQPRTRELTVALIMIAYVLATPCGPPVLRAAIALLMLLTARMIGRPHQYLNMLAAAAIIIVAIRPPNLFDAGFQLTFLCTTALVLFAEPFHQFLFSRWLTSRESIAAISTARFARHQFHVVKYLTAAFSVGIISAATAAPLIAFHFARFNPHAFFTSVIAFPFVALTMAASAIQLVLELASTTLAALIAPITIFFAQLMIRVINLLAALPLATIALRPPPAWIVMILYIPLLLLALRHHLPKGGGSSRFSVLTLLVALTITAAWYTFSQPTGELRLTALSVNQGSTILLQTPSNQLLLLNAGSRDYPALPRRALIPAIQQTGRQKLDAMILTSLDTLSAQYAAETIQRYRPPLILTAPHHLGQTRASIDIHQAITTLHLKQQSLATGTTIALGKTATLRNISFQPMLLLEHQNRRILLLDPAAPFLPEPPTCDAILFLGPRPATLSPQLQKLIEAARPQTIIYSGRSPWVTRHNLPLNELNTADGAITLTIAHDGKLQITKFETRGKFKCPNVRMTKTCPTERFEHLSI
ncbi:MAG: ComEC/Rec2 family competence protein, partial [Phycisphaerales bacterium]|nr:ComEC/Rec2 family competence protein [Phycisphaerales bacterium]